MFTCVMKVAQESLFEKQRIKVYTLIYKLASLFNLDIKIVNEVIDNQI